MFSFIVVMIFREFRGVGKALRTDTILSNIPILALTATAVPRVQKDICDSLHLYNPFVSRQSLDRSNLQISVLKKNGVPHAMNDLVSSLNSPGVRSSKQSTIVYAPTRSQVDELTLYLQNNVQKEEENGVRIEAYHAGLSQDARNQAHTKFLTGFTTVIVATVAFGMGIDKPDTRRVIHFGCPKTLEEYYQQIGRAGRDGLPAECTMYVSESDFDRYKTDFYLGGLSGTARQATEASMAALRVYSLDVETCRRKALLSYFKETPAFGERCGTCDACKNAKTYGADSQRDFGPLGARVLLQTIDCLSDQGIGNIVKVVSGSLVESYRYKFGNSPQSVQQTIQTAKEKLSKKYSQTYYKDMISQLAQKGHLIEKTKTTSQNGFDRTYTVYNISSQGREVLTNSKPIILSVPESVRQIERDEEAKRQKILARLAENGIPLHNLPQEEVSTGDGVVIRAYSKWFSYTESLKKSGREERISHMEDLLNRVENWRSATAVKQRIAPASVLSEHMLYSIAYTAATMSPGVKLEATVLEAAGVRSQEIGALVLELGNWVDRVQPKPTSSSPLGSSPGAPSATMVLTETGVGKGWPFAVYKPQKKTGLMVWEQSYVRFAAGESPQTIAMSPSEDRRPVQVKTVVGHILDAIVYGRNVDLQKLASIMAAPTEQEWDQLQSAEASSGMDVTGDPNISGLNGDKFLMTDFVRPILGETLANTPFSDRTEADRDKVAHWFDLLKWYMSLRRAGYNPTFRL